MEDRNAQVGWTSAQWNRVREEVLLAWQQVRVAGSFLPAYGPGPLPPSTQIIPSEVFRDDGTVDDEATAVLQEISLPVTLSRQQVMEEDLSSALLQFRRRATQLGQLEDWYIFNGNYTRGGPELRGRELRDVRADLARYDSDHVFYIKYNEVAAAYRGTDAVKESIENRMVEALCADTPYRPLVRYLDFEKWRHVKRADEPVSGRNWLEQRDSLLKRNPGALGLIEGSGELHDNYNYDRQPQDPVSRRLDVNGLMDAVVTAKSTLEEYGYVAPFVCIFGRGPFELAHLPNNPSLASPRDRIEPLVGREILHASAIDIVPAFSPLFSPPLLRSPSDEFRYISYEWRNRALLLSLAGGSIDLVIAAEATPEFRQIDTQGRYIFSVFERFALRIKDRRAIVGMGFE